MSSKCSICKRLLDVEDDPLSVDCGGDCWGCIGEMEADMGSEDSLEMVRKEFKEGLRQDWMPSPKITFKYEGIIEEGTLIDVLITIVRPLGEPWRDAELRVNYVLSSQMKKSELERLTITSDATGKASLEFKYPRVAAGYEVWVEIERGANTWSFPIPATP